MDARHASRLAYHLSIIIFARYLLLSRTESVSNEVDSSWDQLFVPSHLPLFLLLSILYWLPVLQQFKPLNRAQQVMVRLNDRRLTNLFQICRTMGVDSSAVDSVECFGSAGTGMRMQIT